jgi:hypothetical protein
MITDFIIDKISSYIVGGMRPETAAYFTRGELAAIYKGQHYSKDASGAFRVTPPPETLRVSTAMGKADAAIKEILKYYAGSAKGKTKAPENKPLAQGKNSLSGFEKMAEYARNSA